MPTGAPINRITPKTRTNSPVDDSETKRVLVIGGTSFIGKRLVTELLKHHHEVFILHRSQQHSFGKRVTSLTADRADIDAVRKAIGAIRFDAVFDLAYDWQNGTTGR